MNRRGQALVEFALIAPALMLLLLGIIGVGMLYTAQLAQQAATNTLAAWAGDNDPDGFGDYAATVTPCDDAAASYAPGLVVVTVKCPSVAGQLLPGWLPDTITTTATSYVATAEPTPEPSPSPSPEASVEP